MGGVPQTSLTLGRKRVTCDWAPPARPSPVTEEPLPPELLTAPPAPEVKLHVVCLGLTGVSV